MGITNMIGYLGTAVPAAVHSAPAGNRLRSIDSQMFARGAGWQPVPVRLTVLPKVTDKCTGVSASGRRDRQ